jgi:ferredoxin-NADP reductase
VSANAALLDRPVRGRFHRLTVSHVVEETADARSYVLAVPEALREVFAYRPGQFVTLRAEIAGEVHLRSYSMSSCPGVDPDLVVTVKRVPGGAVSGWLIDHLAVGSAVDVNPPGGSFLAAPGDADLVALAAGSGITPIMSLIKAALHTTGKCVRLLYANADPASTIFAAELAALRARFADRFQVTHHVDVVSGFVTVDEAADFLDASRPADIYICGPAGFMDLAEKAALKAGVPRERVHIERFTCAPEDAGPEDVVAVATFSVTARIARKEATVQQRAGETILRSVRRAGLSAPSSCEGGSCATCMARLLSGTVDMKNNEALTEDEVAEGWILTCQSTPTSDVEVIYE